VGLAAPQVGINRRLMVYNPEGQPGLGVETVLCNPSIVEWSAEQELFEEGCLSFPGIYADVMVRPSPRRPRACPRMNKPTQIYANPSRACTLWMTIRMRAGAGTLRVCRADAPQRPLSVQIAYQDIRGAKKRMSLDGFQARIFQHEFDHLQGVLYCDRMAPDVLASVEPQLAELRAEWEAGGGAPAAP